MEQENQRARRIQACERLPLRTHAAFGAINLSSALTCLFRENSHFSCHCAREPLADSTRMNPRPAIFLSAVSRELKSARQLAANTLTFLGCHPEWQDISGSDQGDLRASLRRRID